MSRVLSSVQNCIVLFALLFIDAGAALSVDIRRGSVFHIP